MILRIYNPDFTVKTTLTKLSSLQWTNKFYDVGSFELHTTEDVASVNDLIGFTANGKIHGGIIMQIVKTASDIAITGFDFKGLMNFRYVQGATVTGTPEGIIKTMLTDTLKTSNRNIPALTVEADSGIGPEIEYTYDKDFVADILNKFTTAEEIGIAFDFDGIGITARTIKGTDKHDVIIFGRKFRNVDDIEYKNDIFNTYNVIYYPDETETLIEYGTASGILRREGYTDKEAEKYAAEKAEIESLELTANSNYVFNLDYTLGDYVSVIYNGIMQTKQITEVEEVFEHGRSLTIPTLGNVKQNPLKKLLKG